MRLACGCWGRVWNWLEKVVGLNDMGPQNVRLRIL